MRSEWEPVPPIKAGSLFYPAIGRGYEELMFPERATSTYEGAMWQAKLIAERRNLPWWRRLL